MDRKFVVTESGIYGIYAAGTNIFTEDNKIINVKTPEEPFKEIEEKEVPAKTRKLLKEILKRKQQWIHRQSEQNNIQSEIEKLEKSIAELMEKSRMLEQERESIQKEINVLVKAYSDDKIIREIKKTVKGNENLRMSFYDRTLDRIKAKAIILKSKRPITYTYGLAYRNPTTYHVPKTMEEAFEIIDTEGLLDITFSTNEIHLNAYSGNDMW